MLAAPLLVTRLTKSSPPPPDPTLRSRLEAVVDEVLGVSEAARRSAPTLIAVTKSVSADVAVAFHREALAVRAGRPSSHATLRDPIDLAENRADRFRDKVDAFDEAGLAPTWHFIGHLQRNKARRVIERAHVLHSVDSPRLAATVTRLATELERSVEVFLEVNLTGEADKHGLKDDELERALLELAGCPATPVRGLMVMGPSPDKGRRSVDDVFAEAAELAAALETRSGDAFQGGRCLLSMGMSADLPEAVRHGTSFVRIGSALFAGDRQQPMTRGEASHG